MRSSVPTALINPAHLPTELPLGGLQVRLGRGERRSVAWILGSEAVPISDGRPVVQLSFRARESIDAKIGDEIEIYIPPIRNLRVAPARIDDLPHDDVVQLSPAVARELGAEHDWALAIADGLPFPVRFAVRRRVADSEVRLSLQTRVLLGVERGGSIVLAPFAGVTGRQNRRRAESDVPLSLRIGRACRELVWNQLIRLLDALGRVALVAPAVSLRTVPAQLGDDTRAVIRLDEDLFAILGLAKGEQVFLNWGRRVAVGVALPWSRNGNRDQDAAKAQEVDLHWQPRGDRLPRSLIVGVSAEVRSDLGMPRFSTVSVRRRVLPLVVRRVNDLTIPVGGLLLAGYTIKGVSPLTILVGCVIVTLLALLPLRHARRPRGRIR